MYCAGGCTCFAQKIMDAAARADLQSVCYAAKKKIITFR